MAVRKIRFGTDGWRGIIADDYTYENIRYCAQGLADYVQHAGVADRGVVVGYDTRFASEGFATATAEVLAGNGVRAYLCSGYLPTPVISFGIVNLQAGAGATITASHNPAIWNGFKVRSHYGGAITSEVIAELEGWIDRAQVSETARVLPYSSAVERGLILPFDPSNGYVDHLRELIDVEPIRRAGLKIAVDSMYGAGINWFSRLVSGGATEIVEINGERNPLFGGIAPEPIPRNLESLLAAVTDQGAAVGLATDGDADRLGVCDEKGRFINQLQVYSLLALYLLEVQGLRGPIVKTLSTSSMLDRLGEIYGVPVHETAVGFKFVAPKMMETDALVGGEESGGYAFRGHLPERDGILAGLFILDLMVRLNKTPSELVEYLFSKVGPHYYDRLDIHFPAEEREAIMTRLQEAEPTSLAELTVVRKVTVDGFKFYLADGSWVLIRFSGTEPVMRVYVETRSPEQVNQLLGAGRGLTGV